MQQLKKRSMFQRKERVAVEKKQELKLTANKEQENKGVKVILEKLRTTVSFEDCCIDLES